VVGPGEDPEPREGTVTGPEGLHQSAGNGLAMNATISASPVLFASWASTGDTTAGLGRSASPALKRSSQARNGARRSSRSACPGDCFPVAVLGGW
jgi:hypothetical protein